MADQLRRRWAAADDGVLYEVARRIPCEIDRRHMGRVCNSWRVALVKLKAPAPPPPLPWLALPESDDGLPATVSCVLSGCRTHAFSVLQGARGARYFGSYDGGWLFLAVGGQAQCQALLNLKINGFQTLDLPNLAPVNSVNPNRDREMAIVAATLSCQPTEQGCIVAGIIESSPNLVAVGHVTRSIAFWRMGDQVVLPVLWALEEDNPLMRLEEVEDLLCHHGAFHFLTRAEDVLACEEPPVFYRDSVSLVPANMFFLPRVHDENETVLARYLVGSGKKLLMVVRLASGRGQRTTSAFRVFQKKKFNTGEEDEPSQNRSAHFEYYWSELDELDGRMLFVGLGCSRSYKAGDGRYPGMEEGVYFLDDPSIHQMIIGDAPKPPYLCSDNGHVQRVTLACRLKTPRRSRAELARVWVVSQPVSELVEEPGQAPRLGSGGTKPQAEVSRWRSRSSAPLPRPVPPCRGRRRLARSTTAAVVIVGSSEPAAAKLATPSASSSAPSWGEEDGDVEGQPPRCGRHRPIRRARRRQARHGSGKLVRCQARHAVGEIVRAVVGEEDGDIEPSALTAAPRRRQIRRVHVRIRRARRCQARHAVGELVRRQARHAVGEIVRAVVGEEDGGVEPSALTAAPRRRQIRRCRHRYSPPSLDPPSPELGRHRSAAGGREKREGDEGRGEEKRTEQRCRWRRNRREREGGNKKERGWEEADSGSQVV
ncbi:hypothetical protein OsJ_01419 [Oryza sativa Japonica Group]|uniref:KIB1-4 beta-propeller domain-containing protein n=1 Tax=Oryza sativa subsp. japonica TaxID=39947 RepID=A2ZS57_ORYSJ|nr:hypothetical protein OsJ_01419 [Oryza sativa Japonica Group]